MKKSGITFLFEILDACRTIIVIGNRLESINCRHLLPLDTFPQYIAILY